MHFANCAALVDVLFTTLIENLILGGGGATRPLPRDGGLEGWRHGGTPWRSNSRATHKGLDQRSKIEEVVPKMARRRGSDAEQSRKR